MAIFKGKSGFPVGNQLSGEFATSFAMHFRLLFWREKANVWGGNCVMAMCTWLSQVQCELSFKQP